MMFPIVVVMIFMTFAVQLLLCVRGGRRWIQCIPLYLIGAGEIACAVGYFLLDHIYGVAFAAVIYSVELLIMLASDALAWLTYILVNKAQKSK